MAWCRAWSGRWLAVAPVVLAVGLLVSRAGALVNPQLQMHDVLDRYEVALIAHVAEVDLDAGEATLEVERVLKGEHSADRIRIVAERARIADDMVAWEPGQMVCALIGQTRRRGQDAVLFYTGSRVPWQQGELADNGVDWRWQGPIAPEGEGLWGTWNGRDTRLAELMSDIVAGRAHFPAVSFARFAVPEVVHRAEPGRLRGVAAHDLNGDARPDLVAAATDGVRVFYQDEQGEFQDVTEAVGLEGEEARSVSVASVRGDDRKDLLLDGHLWLRGESGWSKSDRLDANAEPVVSAGFIEYDGDGYPDVIVSRRGGGLALYQNPGEGGGAFTDVTAKAGLDALPEIADATGYVTAGDWNHDGRTDLFYAVKPGVLLVQNEDGRYEREALPGSYEFAHQENGELATGASTFAPLWRADRQDLLVASQSGAAMLTRTDDGTIQDVSSDGNELADSIYRLLGGLAEDWNADGTVDVLGLTDSLDQSNVYLMNRGYGSWMRVEKYRTDVLPGALGEVGVRGAATADLDGDGAVDAVLSGADGVLRVVYNHVLEDRPLQPAEHATRLEQYLAGTRAIRIRVDAGRGVVGAQVRLLDERGNVLTRRVIGGNLFTGCRSEDAMSVTVTEAGEYRVAVRWSDGTRTEQTLRCPGHVRLSDVVLTRP